MTLEFAAIAYRSIRDRLRAEDPTIDEQTLADTVEGLTDLHEILAAIIRSALADEALANGLKTAWAKCRTALIGCRIAPPSAGRSPRTPCSSSTSRRSRRPIFRSRSARACLPCRCSTKAAVPSIFWQPSAPRLKRQELINELKTGADIEGVALSNPEPVLSVRVK